MEHIQSKASKYHLSFHLHHLNLPLYMEEHAPVHFVIKAGISNNGKRGESLCDRGRYVCTYSPGTLCCIYLLFEDEPNRNMHDANEHIDIKRFMKHGEICLQAMYDMIMEP